MDFKPFFENHFNTSTSFYTSTTNVDSQVSAVVKKCSFDFNRIEASVLGFHKNNAVLRIFTDVFLATCPLSGSLRKFDSVLVPFEGESLEQLLVNAIYKRDKTPKFKNPQIDFKPYFTKVFTRAKCLNIYATEHAFYLKSKRGTQSFNHARVQILGFNDANNTAYANVSFCCYMSNDVLLGGQITPSIKMLEIPTRAKTLEDLVFVPSKNALMHTYEIANTFR